MKDIELLEKFIAVLIGLLTFWGVVWKLFIKKWYTNYLATRNQWRVSLMEQILKTQDDVKNVKFQVFPNGGSSLLDKVILILENQTIIKETHDACLYLDSTPIIKTDMTGNCTWVNMAWLKLSGFSDSSEALGNGWLRSIHPDDRDRVKAEFIESIKHGSQFVSNHRKKNISTNAITNVTKMTRIVKNSQGKPIELIGVIQIQN